MSRSLLLSGFAVVATLAAADLPFAGKWKMNPAKSDFGATTITYTSLPSGEWESTADGQTYKFKMDGQDYPDGYGGTAAWKSVDASTWETMSKLNGKVLSTDALKASEDGRTLTVKTKGTKPNGDPIDSTITFERVSGGPGLAGKWKTRKVESGSPPVLEMAASGSDGLSYKVADMDLSCEVKFDGKDYPCTGPTLAPGWTVATTRKGARALDMTVKKDGKLLYKVTYTVASDGRSMAETGGATATREKIKVVYDRQ